MKGTTCLAPFDRYNIVSETDLTEAAAKLDGITFTPSKTVNVTSMVTWGGVPPWLTI